MVSAHSAFGWFFFCTKCGWFPNCGRMWKNPRFHIHKAVISMQEQEWKRIYNVILDSDKTQAGRERDLEEMRCMGYMLLSLHSTGSFPVHGIETSWQGVDPEIWIQWRVRKTGIAAGIKPAMAAAMMAVASGYEEATTRLASVLWLRCSDCSQPAANSHVLPHSPIQINTSCGSLPSHYMMCD